jgi:hypothetical protein
MALILDFYKENSLVSLELSVRDPVYYVEEHGYCQNCFTKQFHKKYSNLIKLFLLIYIVLKVKINSYNVEFSGQMISPGRNIYDGGENVVATCYIKVDQYLLLHSAH